MSSTALNNPNDSNNPNIPNNSRQTFVCGALSHQIKVITGSSRCTAEGPRKRTNHSDRVSKARKRGKEEKKGSPVLLERGETEEEQRRNRGGTEEEQRRNRGGTEEEQRRNRGGTEEEQKRNRGGTEEEKRRRKGGTEEERGSQEEEVEVTREVGTPSPPSPPPCPRIVKPDPAINSYFRYIQYIARS